ncbi:30S ribosomal protein S4 [Candidatus Pacearchaeota archaeon]|nr:30S ribosomal protein S4 [Candidatus Pacearchaeota archaeon]
MIRKPKMYVRPKKLYQSSRIAEENILKEKYGLKNKKEIWKTNAKLGYFRRRAKSLARSSLEEQEVLFRKLQNLGLKTSTISEVLALKIEDILERRLPTVLLRKGLANTSRQARQLVTHKKVTIDGKIVNIPSYIVSISEENKIKVGVDVMKKEIAPGKPEVEEEEAAK